MCRTLRTEERVPTINVRLFAGLRETVGQRTIDVDVPEGATVAVLCERIGDAYPLVRPFLSTVVCAVGEEYVPGSHILRAGDAVALIPPVSGGR